MELQAEDFSDEQLAEAVKLVGKLDAACAVSKLSRYEPYAWQQEFHAAGKDHPERMLMAANRVGKTMSAGAEVAFHLTGDYPEPGQYCFADTAVNRKLGRVGKDIWPKGWTGKRFDHPVLCWTGSPTNETSRDIVQVELLGGLGEKVGTGWIPKSRIVGKPQTRQAGVKNVIDSFQVRHRSGGLSTATLKTYEQGWQKWQGTQPHVVWCDEEPEDYKIFSESQTRILTSAGIAFVTFTPLHGMTELVQHFQERGRGIYLKSATWGDAPHLSDEDKARLAASYRVHERDARTKGIPMLGEGAIFPVSDDSIVVDPFRVPDVWARIKGCDFGFNHPAAGVEIAWDRDQDIIYVIDCYKEAGQLPPYHAAWFCKANKSVPVSWPHDGGNTEKTGGDKIAESYRKYGVNMLTKSARYPRAKGEKKEKAGPQPKWPVIDEVNDRMVTGRFKVFSNQQKWLEEKRSYHVKAGPDGRPKIVDRMDDILTATFYAIMMKRYAIAPRSLNYRASSATRAAPICSTAV